MSWWLRVPKPLVVGVLALRTSARKDFLGGAHELVGAHLSQSIQPQISPTQRPKKREFLPMPGEFFLMFFYTTISHKSKIQFPHLPQQQLTQVAPFCSRSCKSCAALAPGTALVWRGMPQALSSTKGPGRARLCAARSMSSKDTFVNCSKP